MKTVLVLLVLAAAVATAEPQIVGSFAAPATGVTGLAFDGTYLWAITSARGLYKLDPEDGTILATYYVSPAIPAPDGLGYCGSLLYVTGGTASVYKYNTSGSLVGTSVLYCSG